MTIIKNSGEKLIIRENLLNNIYDMKHILVTGANGYIGRHVVKAMLDAGFSVTACDICLDGVDERADKKRINLFEVTEDNLFQILGAPDACLHMAWRDGFIHNSNSHLLDFSAHYRFLTQMIDGGLKQLAVMGSMHEIGYWEGSIDEKTPCNPLSLYGISKDALRRSMLYYCKQHECKLQWLRAYYILGDDLKSNSIFCKILQAAESGKVTFPFTTGKNQYDFLTVDELALQILSVLGQEEIDGIINCCSGKPVPLADKVEQFIKSHNLNIKLEYGAFPDRPYDSPIVYGDVTKINRILSFVNSSLNI